ncbi:PREDICTED: uncharacterized protein LOC109337915 [Lupinus angustifolius]|uniref:uncharacterized protein LOC109337915 n=1 Tax=Lupinus angustifolius TaxID=3871 RepID=UPI00092E5003|nr:PREDICTED: uncharacterized protein LOC109337915 [Lupinus angustifolius]XP_019430547.1 PREDICTED: uncharacterized protein LOC109337915 [Lupinus angustifolius]XP_019430549.1 PREDICTED: uncharacterized protein LOC109337915 [Lupinus angustifolius]
MDQDGTKRQGEVLDHVHEGGDENSSVSVEGAVIRAVDGVSLGGKISISGEVGSSKETGNNSGLNKEMNEGPEEVKGPNKEKIIDTLTVVDEGTSNNSKHLVNQEVLETVVVIDSVQNEHVNGDNRKLEAKVTESGLREVPREDLNGVPETDKSSCVIDIRRSNRKGLSDSSDGERVCRICYLASGRLSNASAVGTDGSTNGRADLIHLGCACKDELGIAHILCAEAWFGLKGNRVCEICGETAKNITGIADRRFLVEWNERGHMDEESTSSRLIECWQGQPFCNFVMAFLVIAFVLPWFFHVNMY